jgi:hypothetical protein
MVNELRQLADALTPISGVQVLRTRWYAEKINAPLPAIIVDYERPFEPFLLESSEGIADGDYFYLELAVKPDFVSDPLEALERLEELIEETKSTLEAAYPNATVEFLQPDIINMPFGKQTSLSFITDLYIG